jgi:hypothetical protein
MPLATVADDNSTPLAPQAFGQQLQEMWTARKYDDLRRCVEETNRRWPGYVPGVVAHAFVLNVLDGKPVEALHLLRKVDSTVLGRSQVTGRRFFEYRLVVYIGSLELALRSARERGENEADWTAHANPDLVRSEGPDDPLLDMVSLSPCDVEPALAEFIASKKPVSGSTAAPSEGEGVRQNGEGVGPATCVRTEIPLVVGGITFLVTILFVLWRRWRCCPGGAGRATTTRRR